MGKLRMTSPEPRGKGESDSVSEPPNQGPTIQGMAKARQGQQNGEQVDRRTPITGGPETSSASPNQTDLKRVKSSKGGLREVKPFTQFRKNKIQAFNNEHCLRPGQPLFGKMGSPAWIDQLSKYLSGYSRAVVKASDMIGWIQNFHDFFLAEHERVRAGVLPLLPREGQWSSSSESPESSSHSGHVTSTSLPPGPTPTTTTLSAARDSEDGGAALPGGGGLDLSLPPDIPIGNLPGTSGTAAKAPNSSGAIGKRRQPRRTTPMSRFMAEVGKLPPTRDNLNLFTTALIKLIDKGKREGSCPEMNLDVCHHIMLSMKACCHEAGKV